MRGFRSIAMVGLVMALAGPAQAFSFAESVDAGDLPATAKKIVGTDPLETISGNLTAGDIDLYKITITNPASFSATTFGTSPLDTQLWLFRANGTGIAANDDTGLELYSTLPAGHPLYSGLLAGEYLLGISAFNNDPLSGGVPMFGGACGFSSICAPSVAGALTGWTTSSAASGAYTITLTGAGGVIPEPTAALLFALGFGVIGGTRRRTRAAV
jgi:hypothetical protein